jgi:hypothetical protein
VNKTTYSQIYGLKLHESNLINSYRILIIKIKDIEKSTITISITLPSTAMQIVMEVAVGRPLLANQKSESLI